MPLFRRAHSSNQPDPASPAVSQDAKPASPLTPPALAGAALASAPLAGLPRVSYLPAATANWSIPQTIAAATEWLNTCPGQWTVVATATPGVVDTRLQALSRHHRVITAQALLREPPRPGGILVAWPDAETLGIISAGAGVVTAEHRILVLEWGQGSRQSAWLRAHHGVDARYAMPYPGSRARLIPFVVESHLAEIEPALRGTDDQLVVLEIAKSFARLQDEGHGCDPDGLWAWALERGLAPNRAELLRQRAMETMVTLDALPKKSKKSKKKSSVESTAEPVSRSA